MDRLYTLRRAAARLDVSERFLRRLYASGRLRVVRLGRAVRIPQQEVERVGREGVGR
jgi:excisionase family DNA binding protein